jgi:hypothetical protein
LDVEKITRLLESVQQGEVSVNAALEQLSSLPYTDLGFARLDLHRSLRTGLPEVVLCQGKTPEHATTILESLSEHHARVLGTRATPEMAAYIQERLPAARYDPLSRLITLIQKPLQPPAEDGPFIAVITAGSADLPVAEEACQTLEFFGDPVRRLYDVGVAGLHRLLDRYELLRQAALIISVAGMEGALTSVAAGLVACPVIGVPTSVGYGANFQGLAALLAMLNSCAPGVAVVNIDNGFGAATFAHSLLAQIQK